MSALKKDILEITKKRGIAYSKREAKAGLSKNFIGNLVHDRSRSPNIDAVMKLAQHMTGREA